MYRYPDPYGSALYGRHPGSGFGSKRKIKAELKPVKYETLCLFAITFVRYLIKINFKIKKIKKNIKK